MIDAVLCERGPGRYALNGCLSFKTVNRLLRDSSGLFKSPDPVMVDLSGVERTDSAGLALLVEWMKMARRINKELKFYNMPEQMLEIARTCGLVDVLPIV
jgi:phospholipid transport system transporter-binding protein